MKIDDIKRGAFYASDVIDGNLETSVFRVTKEDATDPVTNKRVPIVKTYQGKEILMPQRNIRAASEDEWKPFLEAVRLVKANLQKDAAATMREMVDAR
jgi:hypothetical protein